MTRRVLPTLVALTFAFLLAAVPAVPRDAAAEPGVPSPVGDPVGANDWSCRPPAAHLEPVIIAHGTYGDRRSLLDVLSGRLKAAGYCVFSLDYGHRATDRIQHSGKELRAFVERVRRVTGSDRVSLVGHSQGGLMARYFVKFLGGAKVVDDLVGLVPPNHGSTSGPPSTGASSCAACRQRQTGSRFLRHLNRGDQTPGRVSYTQISTVRDEVVVPYTSAFLPRGPRTTNVTIQDTCAADPAEHLLIPSSPTALAYVLDALGHRGPARRDLDPGCFP